MGQKRLERENLGAATSGRRTFLGGATLDVEIAARIGRHSSRGAGRVRSPVLEAATTQKQRGESRKGGKSLRGTFSLARRRLLNGGEEHDEKGGEERRVQLHVQN